MAFPSLFLASALLFTSFWCPTFALQLPAHIDGCIHLPVIHSTNVEHFSIKRGIQLQLANRSDVAYYAQLSIGSPPQPVFVQLDTGSFELWVNPDCTTVTGSDAAFCDRAGQYDATQSSSAVSLGSTRTLRYGIGSANISYFTDTISLVGSPNALQQVQFGVATASEDAFSGILGIGYGQDIATRYPNFVDQLQAQNATRVKAYTLALGSKDAREGVIVFGGVDTAKFAGRLARLPIIPAAQSPDGVPRFWVTMQSLALTPPNGVTTVYSAGGSSNSSNSNNNSDTPNDMPVFLDSGSTMTLLPSDLTAAVARDFGASAPDANGFYRIDCGLTALNGTLDFAFAGTTIKVPYKELIREVASDPPACFLGIMASERFTLLGDTFLRSAYTVFDLETNAIWLTQAANCGAAPAALNTVQALSTITGQCGGADDTASQEPPSSTVGNANAGAATTGTSNGGTGGGGGGVGGNGGADGNGNGNGNGNGGVGVDVGGGTSQTVELVGATPTPTPVSGEARPAAAGNSGSGKSLRVGVLWSMGWGGGLMMFLFWCGGLGI